MTTKSLNYKTLYPKIDVYTDLLPDANELYAIMKESEASADGQYYLRQWDKWSIFGTYSQEKHHKDEPRIIGERYDKEKHLSDRVYEAYNIAINDYLIRNQIELPPGSHLMSSSFSKYNEQIDTLKNSLTMQYHTDYIIAEKDMPGDKFFLTCTTYINDDYDGGDICFYINGESIDYKPKAGDILVFPSTEPFYHGVKSIVNGCKFFVRNFIVYPFNGTKEWLENQRIYGAYKWAKMEQERIDFESPRNMLFIVNNKPVSYEEMLQQKK